MVTPSDYRNCLRKRQYVTKGDAVEIAREINAKNMMRNQPDRVHVYCCTCCLQYHLGHSYGVDESLYALQTHPVIYHFE